MTRMTRLSGMTVMARIPQLWRNRPQDTGMFRNDWNYWDDCDDWDEKIDWNDWGYWDG